MDCTIHIEIERPKEIKSLIPHDILEKTIRTFIENNDLYQEDYYIDYNHWFAFIYLDGQKRIDVAL